jgi:hypothetical protein
MGLVLHYQLTAHTNATRDAPDGAYKAQLLFGLALKALHDHPSIADSTIVNGVNLLAAYGLEERGNAFRLTLRPVPVEDAVQYWTAGQGPARLAAYYQVSVALLEPERAAARSTVLERGVTVFAGGAPHLSGSRSSVTFQRPDAAQPRSVVVSPAQVAIGGRFTLLGSNLTGEATDLVLETSAWAGAESADSASWEITASPGELSATVQPSAGARMVVPGVYSVAVRVRQSLSSGATPELVQSSNRVPILVTPELSDPGAAAPGSVVVLTGSLFAHATIPTDVEDDRSVQIVIGAERLALDTDGTLTPGEFTVTDANTLTLALPSGLPPGPLPLRVRVNGAESPPRWIRVLS